MNFADGASPPAYPLGLEPSAKTPLRYHPVEVETARVPFKQGDAAMLAPHGFGKKPVVMYGGEPMFAELALQRMCVEAGWNARWLQTYSAGASGPKLYAGWDPRLSGRSQSVENVKKLFHSSLAGALLEDIANKLGGYRGCWDVVAWTADDILFIESKWKGRDSVNKNQEDWLVTARSLGVPLDRFLVAEWTFTAD